MNVDRLMKTPPGRLVVKMGDDQAFNWAVIIAWNFLQSLFPIALVMAAVLGVGLGYIGVSSHLVYGTVASIIPDGNAQKEVLATLNTFQQRSGIFFLVGFVGLVWSGAGLFRTMEQGFAVIYLWGTQSPSSSKSNSHTPLSSANERPVTICGRGDGLDALLARARPTGRDGNEPQQ